jgi:heterodisulfide reductase subunit C
MSTEQGTEFRIKETIRSSRLNRNFPKEVMKSHGGEKLLLCYLCGSCAGGCPVGRLTTAYNPRKIVRMASLGLKDEVLKSNALWFCTACFTCTDRCPQGLEVASIIRIIRNIAAENGIFPQVFKELGSNILETGLAYKIPELRLKKREDQKLPPLPPSNAKAVDKLLEASGFLKLIKEQPKKEA